METYKMLQVLVMYSYLCLYSVTADTAMYSPFEFRTAPGEMGANKLSVPNSNIPPREYHVPQQQIIHTGTMQSQHVPNVEKVQTEHPSFKKFLNAINEYTGTIVSRGVQDNQKHHTGEVNKYKYSSPTQQYFDSWMPTVHDSASLFVPPTTNQHESTNKASAKFNILEPISSKVSSKMNGLIGLILSLLGSGSDNLITKGIKDIVIDGIIKPLLVAKGGLKELISKLVVPLISLLLINFEVLVTVWWLWDDCPKPQPVPYPPVYPQPVQPQPQPSYPPADNYNNYNTTYSYR